jgi:A/G-specific adenine glycosylase
MGYPRRAANLHRAARAVVDHHDGEVPRRLEELLALPGVGAYTARAVLAFAFERDVGVVDTNIARVLARVAGERLTPKAAQVAADAWVPAGRGWAWNQTLMDLGAALCRPAPRCGECPLWASCAWAQAGRPDPDPAAGSAGVSRRQASYVGSDRQARGRLMARLGAGPLDDEDVPRAAGLPDDPARAALVVRSLVDDGLARVAGGTYRLA